MSIFDLIVGIVPAALQLALAIIMLRRKDYEPYPFFFTYTVYSVFVAVAHLTVIHHPMSYFLLHWTSEAIYGVLAVLAIAEVFNTRLQLIYENHPPLRYCLLPAILISMTCIGLWQGVYHPVGKGKLVHMAAGVYGFVIGVRCLESGVYFLAALFRKFHRLPLADRPFKILTGFGLAAFFSLIAYVLRYRFGPALEMVFRYPPIAAYIASTCLWLSAFLKPEPPKITPKPELEKVQALLDSLHQQERTFRNPKIRSLAPRVEPSFRNH